MMQGKRLHLAITLGSFGGIAHTDMVRSMMTGWENNNIIIIMALHCWVLHGKKRIFSGRWQISGVQVTFVSPTQGCTYLSLRRCNSDGSNDHNVE